MFHPRSPPPLQHPIPTHPPYQIPSTSPPLPETPPTQYSGRPSTSSESSGGGGNGGGRGPFGSLRGGQAEYQRFSSPSGRVPNGNGNGLMMDGMNGPGGGYAAGGGSSSSWSTSIPQPDSYVYQGAHYLPSQSQSQSQSQRMGNSGGGYGNGGGGTNPAYQDWMSAQMGAWGVNVNDATTQMGMQFGKNALGVGHEYVQQNLTRYLPAITHLKHSFNVSNGYVLRKIKLVLWPWRHGRWSRQIQRSETTGQPEGYRPPREDINCPDLYIPVMSLTTYILLSGLHSGLLGKFDPSTMGSAGSTSLGILFLEFLAIKLGCYVLNIGGEGTVVELVAYEGYKFVGIIVCLLAGLLGISGILYWLVFGYVFSANAFFLLRSLRYILLLEPSSPTSNPASFPNPISSISPSNPPHHPSSSHPGHLRSESEFSRGTSVSHSQKKARIQFLFAIAVGQIGSMWVLGRV